VLDTSPYPSPEAAAEQELVLRRKDATAEFHAGFTSEIESIATRLGIQTSYKDAWIEESNLSRSRAQSLGRTELGRLVAATGGAITGTTLQFPTTGYHTANETVSLASIEAMLKLLESYL